MPGRRPGRGPLTDTQFSAAVAAVTSAFGDPTRRQIYLFVREHDDGVTASEVADRFALHSNVARHHLDKLTAGGYLEVHVSRPPGGGAGRPSKRYRKSAQDTGVEAPRRGDDLLVMLLGQALALIPPGDAERMAEAVGRGLRPPAGRPDVDRRGASVLPGGPARHRRRPDGPRVRGPRRGPGRLAGADQGRLPVLRHRQAASGDLRRRPGHGAGHALRPVRRDGEPRPSRRAPWATTPASAWSESGQRHHVAPRTTRRAVAGRAYLDHASTSPGPARRPGGHVALAQRGRPGPGAHGRPDGPGGPRGRPGTGGRAVRDPAPPGGVHLGGDRGHQRRRLRRPASGRAGASRRRAARPSGRRGPPVRPGGRRAQRGPRSRPSGTAARMVCMVLSVDRTGRLDPESVRRGARAAPVWPWCTASGPTTRSAPSSRCGEVVAGLPGAGRAGARRRRRRRRPRAPWPSTTWAPISCRLRPQAGRPTRASGALLVRRGLRVPPLLVGGAQERARRAGLENVAAAVGFGAAAAELARPTAGRRRRRRRRRSPSGCGPRALADTRRRGLRPGPSQMTGFRTWSASGSPGSRPRPC